MSRLTGSFRVSSVAVIGLLMVAAVSTAETIVYEYEEEALFSIEIPDGWLVDLNFSEEARQAGVPEGEEPAYRIVEVSPTDGGHVWLGIWAVPEAETLDEGVAYFRSLRQDLFTDVKVSEPEKTKKNGMEARTASGTALRDGEPVELAMALFEPRPGAVVAALYVGELDTWKARSEELERMIASLEPSVP